MLKEKLIVPLIYLLFFHYLAFSSPTIDSAFFTPDPFFPYQLFKEGFQPAGIVEIYIKNPTSKPVHIQKISFNNQDITEPQKGEEIVWWRLRPDPLPPNSYGEILIRLRHKPKEKLKIKLLFSDTSGLSLSLTPTPPPISIETLAFDHSIRTIFLFLRLRNGEVKIKNVYLDGQSFTRRTKILGSWRNICPIIISLPHPLSYGSFHYLKIETTKGDKIGAVFRARDDFFPLGSYGYVTPEEYSKNHCNIYASFSPLSKEQLDFLGNYHIMGISAIGDNPPQKDIVNHPCLWAYYLMDEPDVHDYFVESLAHPLRPGIWAMEMVRRDKLCYTADKRKLTFLTINMTYKPVNWFIYGRIADVANTDPYALAIGADMKLVYDVSETARIAFAPSMPMITFQAYYHQPFDKPSNWKFPRMPTPEEENIMIHYALAGGAKGLLSYIHCTERVSENLISYGADDFPEVWMAIGDVYRNLRLITPIISRSQPMDIVKSKDDGLFLRALVATDALVVVCINRMGESQKEGYIAKSIKNAVIEVHLPPWIKPKEVNEIYQGEYRKLSFWIKNGRLYFRLPCIVSACLVLIK